jgi:hypothetical protein
MQIGGRTEVIGAPRGQSGGKPHLVAPNDLDLGSLRAGETARGKLRIANNGSALLTGTARVGPNTPWLRVLGSGTVYCAAGAVEVIDVQADTSDLDPGRQVGAVMLETDGGRATVQVIVTVYRESIVPVFVAALVAAVVVLALAGLVYAANGGKMPFIAAQATATPLPTATARPTATPIPSATSTPRPTATTVNTGATATAVARQAQQIVRSAHATATAAAISANATGTAVSASVANQGPGATQERLAIQAAVNNFLLVRANALRTGDGSQLASVATGNALAALRTQLANLVADNGHTIIRSIEQPVWDAIDLHGPDSASATLSKHEDELFIRNSTGLADDVDPSYHGKPHTSRNQRFGVTYEMVLVNGTWLVSDYHVYDAGTPQPTKQPNLLPPPGQGPPSAEGTATPVPTTPPQSGGLSVEQVVNQTLPSVLRVTGSLPGSQQSTGTGFVVESSSSFAYVVTNDHVVNGAADITLSTQSSGPLPALSVQEDTADDLAVIKIAQPAHPFPALTWGDSDSAQLGENVVAIGFALGLQGEPTVTNGILSALHRDVGQRWLYLQHTAPINHGNSGGPLLDMEGKVIGINTLLDENAQSVYFAIPAAKAQPEVANLIGEMP